ncbi:MAG: ArnT family glycosyltransferase [Phycisphaeraceae bacterium]
MRHPVAAPLTAALMMAVVTLPLLGLAPLAGTEGHRVIPARHMLESGDWVVPELLGETYLRKPPGHFWLLAASQAVLGDHGWAWRLPSALSAMLLVAGLAWMGRRWFGLGGGWAAGLGGVGLVAIWAQSRTADIDATNTLATVAAAIALLELMLGHPRRRWAWCVLLMVSLGAALLLKLHAGLSLVGGALLAGTILGGLRAAGRPGVWLGLTGGVAAFLAWVVPVTLRVGSDTDTSGVEEAALNVFRLSRLFEAFEAQGLLLLYAMPMTLVLLLSPRLLARAWDEREATTHRRLTLGLLLTLAIGHALLLINGIANVRYGYVLLPVWPLLAASAAGAWRERRLTESDGTFLEWVLAVTSVALPAGAVVMAGVLWDRDFDFSAQPWLMAAFVAGPVVAAGSLFAWGTQRRGMGVALVAAGLLTLTPPMIVLQTQQRFERSGREAGLVLGEALPAGAVVHADALVRDKPEVFVYAEGVEVRSLQGRFVQPAYVGLNAGEFVALTRHEWQAWKEDDQALRLDKVTDLPTREDRPAVLARVSAPPRSP